MCGSYSSLVTKRLNDADTQAHDETVILVLDDDVRRFDLVCEIWG